MPSYKTHSIHGELVLPEIDKKIDIDNEYLKSYCMGPDAMMVTDYKTFDYQHARKTREFFVTMLRLIKRRKLYNNPEVMAYLYGQLDHFVLDCVMHPIIYYMTEGVSFKTKIGSHGLVEMWIDDYTTQKYNKNNDAYYHQMFIKDSKLKRMIDELYMRVYNVKNVGLKYSIGVASVIIFDKIVRRNSIGFCSILIKLINMGDIVYSKNYDRVLPYLNLDNEVWRNPETGEEYKSSFDDLWQKSIEIALETINDVNNYLYNDKELTNPLILNDISFNTGLPCDRGQKKRYIRKNKRH